MIYDKPKEAMGSELHNILNTNAGINKLEKSIEQNRESNFYPPFG